MISYPSLIILSFIIFPLPSSCNHQGNTHSPAEIEVTAHLRTWRAQHPSPFQHHLRNTHGVLNIIGWGTLLPMGAIAARYFRKYPFKCKEWYSVHIMCQTGGSVVGTVGWLIGMLLGHSSKGHSNKTHRTLGIIIFTFTAIQMLAMFWRPKQQEEKGFSNKYVKICHHLLGYALIALTIANIFEGIKNQAHPPNWKWPYVAILCVLGVTALGLEIFKWIKLKLMH
ncbi:unnamed protein product [Malus baccata var. baccata]|uniref:Cytochrome b561 domain-containing protein n=2 Tax=Malus TaxID=3749 RepID=A0A498JU49_MALDO|nr:cytochrome b561 and DOMON domain-containing protein At5g35735-like isoform X1 [Malus domestica]XP_050148971.1 cytochrome b561 and DOMON domain-containing protein At5g35735-like isoform X1 [Malus sylvestris]RXH99419.1 hypothetical protein DVH24_011744 [Malus domestica]